MKKLYDELITDFMNKEYAHAYMNSHQSTRLASQIKVLREQRGLTQQELAELAKMKQERISALEDVNYDAWTISTLRKLAEAFDTTLQISFIPFSQGIEDVENFSKKNLEVKDRVNDLKSINYNRIQMNGIALHKTILNNLTRIAKSDILTSYPFEAFAQGEANKRTFMWNSSSAANDENHNSKNANAA